MGKILITGSAGFIGYHLFNKLTLVKDSVIGIGALDEWNKPALIRSKLLANSIIKQRIELPFVFMGKLREKPDVAIHLAAQTGIKEMTNWYKQNKYE